MQPPKLSFRKLAAIEHECYLNALHLHFDSILLAKARSYASAFAISVLASEEFGKGFGIAELSFQAGVSDDKKFTEHDKKFMMALLSDHKLKQRWFVNQTLGTLGPKGREWKKYLSVWKRYETIQVRKNNALYVGVRTKGNHHILRPFSISPSKAKEQMRTVNDALLGLVSERLRNDSEDEPLDRVFRRRRLLNRLQIAARTLG